MNEEYINNLMLNLIANDECWNPELKSLIESVLKSNCDNNAKKALIEAVIESNK